MAQRAIPERIRSKRTAYIPTRVFVEIFIDLSNSSSPIEQLTIFTLGFSLRGFHKLWKSSGLMKKAAGSHSGLHLGCIQCGTWSVAVGAGPLAAMLASNASSWNLSWCWWLCFLVRNARGDLSCVGDALLCVSSRSGLAYGLKTLIVAQGAFVSITNGGEAAAHCFPQPLLASPSLACCHIARSGCLHIHAHGCGKMTCEQWILQI